MWKPNDFVGPLIALVVGVILGALAFPLVLPENYHMSNGLSVILLVILWFAYALTAKKFRFFFVTLEALLCFVGLFAGLAISPF